MFTKFSSFLVGLLVFTAAFCEASTDGIDEPTGDSTPFLLAGVYRGIDSRQSLRIDANGRVRSSFSLTSGKQIVTIRFQHALEPLPFSNQYETSTTFQLKTTQGATCDFPAKLNLKLLATGNAIDGSLITPRYIYGNCEYSPDSKFFNYAFEKAVPPTAVGLWTDSTGLAWSFASDEGSFDDANTFCTTTGNTAGAVFSVPTLAEVSDGFREGISDPTRNPIFGARIRQHPRVWTQTPNQSASLYLQIYDAGLGAVAGMALPLKDIEFGKLCVWRP